MKIDWSADDLRPLVQMIVVETIRQLDQRAASLPDKTYSEPEAARYLGIKDHVLRDARLRGEINASRIAGRRIRYSKADLLDYLEKNKLK